MKDQSPTQEKCQHCGHTKDRHFTEPYLGQIDDRPDCRFGEVRAVICKWNPKKATNNGKDKV